eukprot:CAMPEP_0206047332 /NCGR_PEP_ID=MMETSP1466-20131121/20950_1 /ASSEMBLY_ACC=CAM_ASM_001126 /TAXON_ID=44452 /ORGANISM="Pavlova gyrans, Strain CCMP608" /LENGTH=383 /DNA_ID=CAMNT_0053422343 /DNA_START=11 /DNA_END=1162 /DNA_ORIENTATION=+
MSQHVEDSDDEIGGAAALFSEKQIPEWAQYYPDYTRLKGLIDELAGMTLERSSSRSAMNSSAFPSSSDSAARVAAAGSGEVEFRTMLDAELSRVNQFVVTTGAELRSQVADLDRDSLNEMKNVQELKASVERCMTQVMHLDDFSSLCQAIFLRVLGEHDQVSEVPMLLQYSQKLYYQPFLQSRCADLSGPLAAIEGRLQKRDADASDSHDKLGKGGLEEPLLTHRQSTVVEKRKQNRGIGGFWRKMLARSHRQPSAAMGKKAPSLTPVKIEPKVFFANERTFLHWMHMCVTLAAVAMAIMAAGGDEPGLALPGLILSVLSGMFIIYAWYMFMWRGEALKAKIDHLDDRVGPTLFVFSVIAAMGFVGFRKIQHAMADADADEGY